MNNAQKEYSTEDLEQRYNDIAALYDLAGELVDTTESKLVADPEAQLALVEPLVHDLGEATDILTEEFVLVAESTKPKKKNRASKAHIEAALRRIYTAIHEYRTRVRAAGKNAANIADAIVTKIQRQVERVMVIFLEFIQISLANLMGHAELEALKVRDARIALMMHHAAMQQQ